MLEGLEEWLEIYSPQPYTVLRTGLGLVILLAGTHKLFRPEIWGAYTAPWTADLLGALGISIELFMQFGGVFEGILGIAIIAEKRTSLAASLTSLYLLAILVNLASAGEVFLEVFIRDLGLFILALGVTIMAAEREE